MSRILIAEDEQGIASFICKGLSAAGFTTTVVADGASAYEYARGGQFDLMVLDLGLPVRDGLTVLRQLRADDVDIPVIVLTAKDAVNDRVAGLEGGADDYMPNPSRSLSCSPGSGSGCAPRARPSPRCSGMAPWRWTCVPASRTWTVRRWS